MLEKIKSMQDLKNANERQNALDKRLQAFALENERARQELDEVNQLINLYL